MAALRAALQKAWAGEAQAVVLLGEPGIGKTRTAEELVRWARAEGARILWGRCWEGNGAPPFWPWREALRESGNDERHRTVHPAGVIADAARLVPEIGGQYPDTSIAKALESDQDRERGFAAVAQVLFAMSVERPVVLVLEDLQDADVPSLLLLRGVLQRMRRHRSHFFVLATCRGAGQEAWLRTIPTEAFDAVVPLGGLGPAATAALVEAALGSATSDALIASLQHMTNGNPLLLHETMHLWARRGAPSTVELQARVPRHLRLILAERVRYLSADCRRLLSIAAVIGNDFDAKTLEATVALQGDSALARVRGLLDEAVRAQIVAAVSEPDGYRFLHALIREFLYQTLGTEERAQFHAIVAAALDNGSADDGNLVQLAYHCARSPGVDAARRAAGHFLQAAERAVASLAYEEAVRLCEGGLEALGHAGGADTDVENRCRLLSTLGMAHKLCGAPSRAREVFREALQLARRQQAADLFGNAVLGYLWTDDSYFATPEAWPLLQEALRMLPAEDSPLRAKLLGTLANKAIVTRSKREQARGAELGRQALAMARRCGDAATMSRAVQDWYFTNYDPPKTDERLAVSSELIDVGEAAGSSSIILQGLRLRLPVLLERGERLEFGRDVAAFATHARQLRQPRWLWLRHLHACAIALLAGRFGAAERLADKMMRAAQRAEEPEGIYIYLAFLFTTRVLQGRLHEVPDFEAAGRNLVEQNVWNTAWRAGVLNGLAEIGRLDAARRGFDEMAAADFSRLPRDANFLTGITFLANVCCILEDSKRAARLYDVLLPFAAHNPTQGSLFPFLGSASRYLGMLALKLGRVDDALRHFEDAVAASHRLQAVPFELLALFGVGEALALRGGDGDAMRAATVLTDATVRAEEIGLGLGLEAAREHLRQCRERSSPPSTVNVQLRAADNAARPALAFVLRCEGPHWIAGPANQTSQLRDLRGFVYLAHLLARTGEPIPASELTNLPGPNGGARAEIEVRDSKSLRSAVTKRLRAAIDKIATYWPEVGAHLSRSVQTGAVCTYRPEPPAAIEWIL